MPPLRIVFRFSGVAGCVHCGGGRLPKVHLSTTVVVGGELRERVEVRIHPRCVEAYKRDRRQFHERDAG